MINLRLRIIVRFLQIALIIATSVRLVTRVPMMAVLKDTRIIHLHNCAMVKL